MAITYRDRRTGKVADMPEPKEVEKQAAERFGPSRYSERAADRQRSTLTAMDDSDRWERLDRSEAASARKEWDRKLAKRWGRDVPADEPEQSDSGSGKPAQADPKAEWVDWAVSQDDDLSREDAESMTKADLVEQYG